MPFKDDSNNDIENQEYYTICKSFSTTTATDDQVLALAKLRRSAAHLEILDIYQSINGKDGKIVKYWTSIKWEYPFGVIEYHAIVQQIDEPVIAFAMQGQNWIFGPINNTQ